MARRAYMDEAVRNDRWFKVKGDKDKSEAVASALYGWIDRLKMRRRAENLLDMIHEAIYEGRPLGGSLEYPALENLRRQKSAPANLNVTRSMVDTVVAKLGKRRPMPQITADDAGWTEKLFGKRASRVLRRKMGKSDVERMTPDVLRDAVIRGTGVAKVVRNGGDVEVERIPRHELVVDPREARYGWRSVRSLGHCKRVSRDVLSEEFPDYLQEIDEAARATTDEWDPNDDEAPTTTDQVDVTEAWHLPSAPGAKDGRHIIAIRGCVLMDEGWTRPRFPVALMHWSSPVRGWAGHGLVEDLTGMQAKVNDVARDIQEALYFGAMLKIFLPKGSSVAKSHLRARHPVVIEYDGGALPQYVAPSPVSAQQIQFLEWLINKMFEIAGISQLSASSKNPLGSNASGKAIDTMYDIESDRFAMVELGYAMFRVDLGQLMVDEARALAEDAKDAKKTGISKKDLAPWINEIDWQKVEIDEGEYHLTLEPVNFLPETRAGKLSYINEMSKAGLLTDPTIIASLFDEPDITRAMRTKLGPYNNLLRVMEGLADPKVPIYEVQPDPHMPLAEGIVMAKAEYNDAQASKAGEEVLDRYRQWIEFARETKKLGDQANDNAAMPAPLAPPGAAGPPGAMGPMGPPGMPPPLMGAPPGAAMPMAA